MNRVALFTIAPGVMDLDDKEQMEKFTEDLNRFYERFDLHVDLVNYGNGLSRTKDGRYSVKAVQGPLMNYVRNSVLCCLIFFCKKEKMEVNEMNTLLRSLIGLKKAEVVAYFMPAEGLKPVRYDIMRRLVKLDENLILPEEKRQGLSIQAKRLLNYGCKLDREKKWKEAEAAYRESLVIQRKLVKADEETYLPDLPLPCHNLSGLFFKMERYDESENMCREALKIRQRLVEIKGDAWLSPLAASYNNLGAVCLKKKNYQEAEKNYQESLAIRKQLAVSQNMTDQVQLADVYANLGGLYYKGMRWLDNAEENYQEALNLYDEVMTKISGTEVSSEQLEVEQMEREQLEAELLKAEQAEAEQADSVSEKSAQPESAGSETAQLNSEQSELKQSESVQPESAQSNSEQSELEQSEPEQLNSEQSKSGQPDLRTLQWKAAAASNSLGVIYLQQNHPEKAEPRYLMALKLYSKLSQTDSRKYEEAICMAHYNLGNVYLRMNQPDRAEFHTQTAYEICSRRKEDSAVCKQLYQIMNQTRQVGAKKQQEQAESFAKQAREMREHARYQDAVRNYLNAIRQYQALRATAPTKKESNGYQLKAALLFDEMALLYWDTLELDKAESCYRTSLEIYQRIARTDTSHLPDVAVANYNLGIFLQDTKEEDPQACITYLRTAFEISAQCLEISEQCQDIYENLQDESLYEEEDSRYRKLDEEAGEDPLTGPRTDAKEIGDIGKNDWMDERSSQEMSAQIDSEQSDKKNKEKNKEQEQGEQQERGEEREQGKEQERREEREQFGEQEKKKSGGWLSRLFGKK